MALHGEGGEIDLLARAFESFDGALEAVTLTLRDLTVQDSGPPEHAVVFEQSFARLERRLTTLASEAAEAALVVRGSADEGLDR